MNQDNLSRINSYLSFKLGDEEFAAHVGKVLNILEMTKITEVPKAPVYMKGVINLRGTVLPVIDTRIKFGMTPTEYTTNTCIIVLDIDVDGETIQVGALVDAVQAVLEIEKGKIMPPPSIGSKYKSEFIEGVANIDEKFIMILDMDAVFSTEDVTDLLNKTEETQSTTEIEEVS
ncbi:MAG: chemotaxis protein CheW [Tenuifilaceae bacterium]|jgi:purine-binding chemotaxis protein CheW|uniref:chemotaxis protein CheW n=1 Tax=Perlabentimonas gracilis TaxID=2715279 RepID=UPI00140AD809|nr:chemotaxis protein CheW [Perlabentimonas gracilis]MDX9768873.1 chemotaxis protein CheW [Tenuifilaceae bacterium]NHB68199.1 chemotaxis protein CheW [Perlabentimonas gracilis]